MTMKYSAWLPKIDAVTGNPINPLFTLDIRARRTP